MPEVPQLKQFPYPSGKPCPQCNPGHGRILQVISEINPQGNQVQRQLRCPEDQCGYQDTDIFDERSKMVSYDKSMDYYVARNLPIPPPAERNDPTRRRS